jgi:hypothetical protein
LVCLKVFFGFRVSVRRPPWPVRISGEFFLRKKWIQRTWEWEGFPFFCVVFSVMNRFICLPCLFVEIIHFFILDQSWLLGLRESGQDPLFFP